MKRASIMLVEDDLGSGQAIKDVLEFLDYDVSWHRCAETVYDEVKASGFGADLVVLDLTLGRVDGVTLIQRLRADDVPVPPIVLFSASTEAAIAKAARDVGAVSVLRKPSGIAELGGVLESALAATRPAGKNGGSRKRPAGRN